MEKEFTREQVIRLMCASALVATKQEINKFNIDFLMPTSEKAIKEFDAIFDKVKELFP